MDAAAIAASGRPILCLDTCALLDLMRDPTREGLRPAVRQAGFDLVARAERGELIILMAEQVRIEFDGHDADVQKDAQEKLDKLKELIRGTEAVAAIYGIEGAAQLGHLDDHVERARGLVQRWLDISTPTVPSVEVAARAFTRVNALRAPARQGKESSKDCLVFETYVEAVAAILAAGAQAPTVFVSSNTRDYLDPGSVLKADIASDLEPLGMEVAVSMEHARNALGL